MLYISTTITTATTTTTTFLLRTSTYQEQQQKLSIFLVCLCVFLHHPDSCLLLSSTKIVLRVFSLNATMEVDWMDGTAVTLHYTYIKLHCIYIHISYENMYNIPAFSLLVGAIVFLGFAWGFLLRCSIQEREALGLHDDVPLLLFYYTMYKIHLFI